MDPANVRPAVAYPFLATYVSGFLFLEKKKLLATSLFLHSVTKVE